MSVFLFALVLVGSYAVIGAGIKLIDSVADTAALPSFRPLHIWVVTIGLACLVNLLVLFDIYSAVLVLALVVGLIIARKVDNIYFITLAVFVFPISVFRILEPAIFLLILPTLVLVIVTSALDELLHSRSSKFQNKLFYYIFAHRPILKITVLLLPFFGWLTIFHTAAFWAFDIAYDLVAYYFSAFHAPPAKVPSDNTLELSLLSLFGKV
ncbi:MAG: hypothetical protein ACFFCJ_06980 [Promethearchaeota archaeon]